MCVYVLIGELDSKVKESPRAPAAGDISPLTPDRRSPSAPKGDISPLTPPMPPPPPTNRDTPVRPASPRTPPLPPLPPTSAPQQQAAEVIVQSEEVVEEEVVAQDASPVSDTELADVSPPKESPKTPSDSGLPSPPLPPLPPQPPPPGESSQSDNSIELPPLPPPPPEQEQQPAAPRPPSPLTSPIGSSPDDMEVDQPAASGRKSAAKSTSGPSDISDTDLPASQSESEDAGSGKDLDDLEKKRAALAKQLEKTKIEGEESEGEIRSDDDIDDASADYMKKFQAIIDGKEEIRPSKSEAKRQEDTSPLSDSISPLAISKHSTSEEDEEGEEGKKKRKGGDSSCKPDSKAKRDDDSDDSKGDDGQGGAGPSGGRSRDAPRSSGDKGSSKSPKESDRKEGSSSSSGKRRDSSSSGNSKHKSHHRHHHKDDRRSSSSSSKRDHHGHHRRSSTSSRRDSESSSSKHRRDSESRSDKHDKKKDSEHRDRDKKDDKKSNSHDKKHKQEKDRLKMESLEKKIREKGAMKSSSGAFKEVDMFAPKPPKPKVMPPGNRTPGSGPASPFAFGAKSPPVFAVKTSPPPAFPPKTPPAFGTKSAPQTSSSGSKKDASTSSALARRHSQEGRNGGSGDADANKVKSTKSFIVPDRVPERKVFPEVPVPSTEGDKLKQHENDIEMAKRRLQEMRDRKRDEIRRKEQLKKELKRQNSSSSRHSDEGHVAKNREKTEKVVARKSAPPPVPTSREERRKSVDKPRKKLTLEDLSDEDEVSDWSDSESPHVKKRIKQRPLPDSGANSSSNSGASTPVHQTRKAALQTQSDQILRSDPDTAELSHFTEEDCIAASTNLAKLHPFLDDEDALSVSSIESDKFDSAEDFIYLDGLESPEETAALLKKFGGCPAVVPAVPEWLQLKLGTWFLKRHEVDVFCKDTKPKRCVLEKTFNERVRKRFGLEHLPFEQPPKKMAKVEPKVEAEYKQEVKKEEVKMEVKVEAVAPMADPEPVKDVVKDDKVDDASDAEAAKVADEMFVDDEMLPVDKVEKAEEVPPAKSPEEVKETKEETTTTENENEDVQEAKVKREEEPTITDTAANEEPMEVEEEKSGEKEAKKEEEDFHGFTELPADDDSRNLLAGLWSKATENLADGGFGFYDLLEHLEQEQVLLGVGDPDEVDDLNAELSTGAVFEVTLPDFLGEGGQDGKEGLKQQELPLSPPDSEGNSFAICYYITVFATCFLLLFK